MQIEPRNVINTPIGLKFAYLLGQYAPYAVGRRIAMFAADRISSRKDWKLIQATRCNQWVANGRNTGKADLDRLVKKNIRNTSTSIFDYYHTINNPTASLRMIEANPTALKFVQRPKYDQRGFVLAGIHMSNFDMVFQMGGLAGVKAMVLTLQDLNPAYQKQLELRKKSGLDIVPASFSSIRESLEHLCAGGMVITAMDRPEEGSSYRPKFFGLPAAMPIHHVFLALKAKVPIVVSAVLKKPDHKYHILFSDPIEMQPHPNRHEEVILNAEAVLHVAEDFIRQDTSQWSMTFPVWPELLAEVPG